MSVLSFGTSVKPLKKIVISHRKFIGLAIVCLIIFIFRYECEYISHNVKKVTKNDANTIGLDVISKKELINWKLKTLLNCHDGRLEMETLQHGQYWILRNLIRGRRSIKLECAESITFTTHGDYRNMKQLAALAARWLGPISVALFAPGYDFEGTMSSIQHARYCLPESKNIRDFVTFHIYFPMNDMYADFYPMSEKEALLWPTDCEAALEEIQRTEMYQFTMNVPYPINVGRNIARGAVNTHFILSADISVYPSLNFIEQFLNMINENMSLIGGPAPRVFAMPLLEMEEEVGLVPNNKADLISLFDTRFPATNQQENCPQCNFIPEFDKWLTRNLSEKLEIITITKRHNLYAHWRPVFVSDNKEPAHDERSPWEDQLSQRLQNFAMCLKDYEYYVLHPAFLVHALDPEQNYPYEELSFNGIPPTSPLVQDEIISQYNRLYGEDKKCSV